MAEVRDHVILPGFFKLLRHRTHHFFISYGIYHGKSSSHIFLRHSPDFLPQKTSEIEAPKTVFCKVKGVEFMVQQGYPKVPSTPSPLTFNLTLKLGVCSQAKKYYFLATLKFSGDPPPTRLTYTMRCSACPKGHTLSCCDSKHPIVLYFICKCQYHEMKTCLLLCNADYCIW